MIETDLESKLITIQLKKFRAAFDVSQQAIGDILIVSNQQYSKYELGENRISAAQVLKISNYYNIPIEKLFTDCEFKQE